MAREVIQVAIGDYQDLALGFEHRPLAADPSDADNGSGHRLEPVDEERNAFNPSLGLDRIGYVTHGRAGRVGPGTRPRDSACRSRVGPG